MPFSKQSIFKSLSTVVFHPVFLALIVTTAIILLFIPRAPKYVIKKADQTYNAQSQLIFYDDLDGNGYSDRILVSNYTQNKSLTAVLIRSQPARYLQEWDFPGSCNFEDLRFIRTGDFDNNGTKEVYLFTVSHDSVFLHMITNLFKKGHLQKTRFISKIKLLNGKPNLGIMSMELCDMNNDGFKEIIFAINSGFPIYPRNVYIYNIRNDLLLVSPKNGFQIQNLQIRDINGDKNNEIVVSGYASQNIKDTNEYRVHDQCCWLIVLDNQLKYLFTPVKFPDSGYSGLHNRCILNKQGFYDLYASYHPPVESGKSLILYHFRNNGDIQKLCSIPGLKYDQARGLFSLVCREGPQMIISKAGGGILSFDTGLRETNVFPKIEQLFIPGDTLDIDGDQKKEIISPDNEKLTLTIFRSDLSDPASVQLLARRYDDAIFSLKRIPDKKPVLVMYSMHTEFHYLYHINTMYYSRWAIYAGIFLAVFLFTLLVGRIQRIRAEQRQKTEKMITELQLKIVRNQMDPHFTMNAINAVVDAIRREETDQACENLMHFSKMYRSLVLSADKIKRALREEIDFTENYLALEKFRFGNRFTYIIRIDPDVDLDWEVPKMVIQSPVENAVKHGLLKKETPGKIVIHARYEDYKLILEITDNGVGRAVSAVERKTSTGKGIEIMEQFFDLYHQITGIRVYSEIIDLNNPENEQKGTKVITVIPLKSSPGKQP